MRFTAARIRKLAAAGRYWWLRDGEVVATDSREPQRSGDVYLLDAAPQWVAQADLKELATHLNALSKRLPSTGDS